MANALRFFHPDGQADELARFIEMVNDFFFTWQTQDPLQSINTRETQT